MLAFSIPRRSIYIQSLLLHRLLRHFLELTTLIVGCLCSAGCYCCCCRQQDDLSFFEQSRVGYDAPISLRKLSLSCCALTKGPFVKGDAIPRDFSPKTPSRKKEKKKRGKVVVVSASSSRSPLTPPDWGSEAVDMVPSTHRLWSWTSSTTRNRLAVTMAKNKFHFLFVDQLLLLHHMQAVIIILSRAR